MILKQAAEVRAKRQVEDEDRARKQAEEAAQAQKKTPGKKKAHIPNIN